MQKWEYCEVEVVIGGPISGVKGKSYKYQSSGKAIENKGDYQNMIAKLGDEGWEMVGSSARIETGLGSKHKINYVFKRPK